MKLSKLTVGTLAVSSFLTFGFPVTNSAQAQCVQADVSVQYSISDSKEPAKRNNDVLMESDEKCSGNASVTTGVQGYIGNGKVEQNRQVRHRQQGGSGNPSNIQGPNVQIRDNVGVDVYNPTSKYRH